MGFTSRLQSPNVETLGALELLVILLLALLSFGANKLPEIGKGLETAIKSFKSGLRDEPEGHSVKPISSENSESSARRQLQELCWHVVRQPYPVV